MIKLRNELEISLCINDYCNFKCDYCISKSNKASSKDKDYKDLVEALEFHFPGTKHISIDGAGEPFLFKNFELLCDELIYRGNTISIITNLSQDTTDFICIVSNIKVENIFASLHIDHRKEYSYFLKKCKFLKESKYNVFPTQILKPGKLKEFLSLEKIFAQQNLSLIPQRLRLNNIHIAKYSNEEKEFLIDRFNKYNNAYLITDINFDNRSFEGQKCYMGYKNIIIAPNGNVYSCQNYKDILGNIYQTEKIRLLDKPHIYKNNSCNCIEKNGIIHG